jgi:hypothetical protein
LTGTTGPAGRPTARTRASDPAVGPTRGAAVPRAARRVVRPPRVPPPRARPPGRGHGPQRRRRLRRR